MKTLKNSMTNKGKKGFTLTELAIVIAVIAILIAVLVPTFSSVISKAKASNESVACSNEWTNYYIDADIAANGTKDNYLVVYTDNEYEDDNDNTYYHGYLATAGVYDSTTQLNVTILTGNIISYNDETYNYVGTYEYMADEVSIYSTGNTTSFITEYSSYTITNDKLNISGNGNTYYLSGEITFNDKETIVTGLKFDEKSTTCVYAIRTYFDVKIANMKSLVVTGSDTKTWLNDTSNNSGYTNVQTSKITDIEDGDNYIDWAMNGSTKKYTLTYTYTENNVDVTNTITIYNNATPASALSSSD